MGKANLFENQNIAKLNAAQKNANKCARKPKNIYKKIDTKISDNHELVANFFKIICKMQRFAQNCLQILPKNSWVDICLHHALSYAGKRNEPHPG